MPKPLTTPPQVAAYTLAYVFMAVGVLVYVSQFLAVSLTGRLFLPLLAAWLGTRFGQRGLVPLALAVLLIVPQWSFQGSDSATFSWGTGPVMAVVCAGLTLVFAAPPRPADESPGVLAGLKLALPVLLACQVSAGITADFYSSSVSLAWGSIAATAAACFLLALSGTLRLGALCLLLTVIQLAGFGLGLLGLTFQSSADLLSAGTASVFAAIGTDRPGAIAIPLAAAIAGWLIRGARDGGTLAAPRALIFAAFAGLLLAPAILDGVHHGVQNRPGAGSETAQPASVPGHAAMAASASLGVAAAQFVDDGADEVTIIAERRPHPANQQNQLLTYVLAALSLAAGLSFGRRGTFWLPIAVSFASTTSWLLSDFLQIAVAYGLADYQFDIYLAGDTARNSISQVVGDAVTVWVFAWTGAFLAASPAKAGEASPRPGT